ncbi:hypothetical protein LTR66_004207 [Elasticomyces elasticus]|nr:hypothetical protein LTR66_004207 [Elasticomyces elasticus]
MHYTMPTPPDSPAPTASGLRPQHFISRGNGVFVPLIAADELPISLQLEGVSRAIGIEQARGMQYLGDIAPSGHFYTVVSLGSPGFVPHFPNTYQHPASAARASNMGSGFAKQNLAPDAMARQAPGQVASHLRMASGGLAQGTRTSSATPEWRRTHGNSGNSDTQALIDAIVASDPSAAARVGYNAQAAFPPPSGILPNQEKKEYCTYWIRTGECDFMQQGCLYKHEMPDKAGLAKIGIKAVPRWWQEKTAIKVGAPANPNGLKGLDWMKRRVNDGSSTNGEEEDGSSSCGSDAGPDTAPEPVQDAVKVATQLTVSSETKPTNKLACESSDTAKHSASDLISFAPLVPSPPSTPKQDEQSPSSSPSSSNSSATIKQVSPGTPKPRRSSWVFVPAGESPEKHMERARTSPPQRKPQEMSRRPREDMPIAAQIQELVRSRHSTITAAKPFKKSERSSDALRINGRVRRPVSATVSANKTPQALEKAAVALR